MRLRRLHVEHFAGIVDGTVQLGPGLNVLYGPNDLGKSTLADALRLALLLPHTSSFAESFVPWSGPYTPVVELELQTGDDDVWLVKKEFGKRGSSLLRWSKNGRDFDDQEKGRGVDRKLRELLRWGIAEPGGQGSPRGLPSSFLATALLSTQAGVGEVLASRLVGDQTQDGRELIAAALQAATQDPSFAELMKKAQARRDLAFTAAGARKSARDSVFKIASENVADRSREHEEWQRTVAASEGVENELLRLISLRDVAVSALEESSHALTLARQARADVERRAAGDAVVEAARAEVDRVRALGATVDAFDAQTAELAVRRASAADVADAARARLVEAEAGLRALREASLATDPAGDIQQARQQLELRRAAAEQAEATASARLTSIASARVLVEAEARARDALTDATAKAADAKAVAQKAHELTELARAEVARCDRLSRAIAVRDAHAAVARIDAVLAERGAVLREQALAGERASLLVARRALLVVPPRASLPAMRRLATELASARGALEVGLVVTVSPTRLLDVAVGVDGADPAVTRVEGEASFDAKGAMDLVLGDVARVRVTGGSRSAQAKVAALQARWATEVSPHLAAGRVGDLEGLEGHVNDAGDLDKQLESARADEARLRAEIARRASVDQEREMAARVATEAEAALDVAFDAIAAEVAALGPDPSRAVAAERARAVDALGVAQAALDPAAVATWIERAANADQRVREAAAARDAALVPFAEGLAVADAAATKALTEARSAAAAASADLSGLDTESARRTAAIAALVDEAAKRQHTADRELEAARTALSALDADVAALRGKLELAKQQRDAEDLPAKEVALARAIAARDALPVPARDVTADELAVLAREASRAAADARELETSIDMKRGALEQVAGNIAKERLAEAEEALALAQRHQTDVEAEYDAWKLLFEQMREADAAQASNLGSALAPAVGRAFSALTARRYQGVSLDADLKTEGVLVGSAVRDTQRLSVGTREQLSTLYRLSLAEHIGAVLVLDDQLVQSDEWRMAWFRELLLDKAQTMQIVVMTCRPHDYVASEAMPDGETSRDSVGGRVRVVSLLHALGRAGSPRHV